MPPTEVIAASVARDRRRVSVDLLALTKPRVVVMVLVTTLVGYYVGLSGAPDWGGCCTSSSAPCWPPGARWR